VSLTTSPTTTTQARPQRDPSSGSRHHQPCHRLRPLECTAVGLPSAIRAASYLVVDYDYSSTPSSVYLDLVTPSSTTSSTMIARTRHRQDYSPELSLGMHARGVLRTRRRQQLQAYPPIGSPNLLEARLRVIGRLHQQESI